jgi:uncharacterized protein YktA (UPF0223 family)
MGEETYIDTKIQKQNFLNSFKSRNYKNIEPNNRNIHHIVKSETKRSIYNCHSYVQNLELFWDINCNYCTWYAFQC